MDFGEKLVALRKKQGLTQEQLSEKLYVSRTAVSKWESGKGYPSIDSLKFISNVFGVSIDDLLSSEKLLEIASGENKNNLRKTTNLVLGIIDFITLAFLFLPFFGLKNGDYIYSVNLIKLFDGTIIHILYIIFIILLTSVGLAETVVNFVGNTKIIKIINLFGFALSIMTIILFLASMQPYATAYLFLLFLVKVVIYLRSIKRS